jgi:hypothetical protein
MEYYMSTGEEENYRKVLLSLKHKPIDYKQIPGKKTGKKQTQFVRQDTDHLGGGGREMGQL